MHTQRSMNSGAGRVRNVRRVVRFGVLWGAFALAIADPGTAGTPRSYFTIHCDPNESPLFPVLIRFVDLATRYDTPLTIELTPQWTQVILADSVKLQHVRMWQAQGHEIAVHHHGIYHAVWDRYTDYSDAEIAAAGQLPALRLGTMADFRAMLDIVAGDSLLFTYGGPGNADPQPEVDWLPGLTCKTFGGRDLSDAFSTPHYATFGQYTACEINYCYIPDLATVDSIQSLYANTMDLDVVGVVTHVHEFAQDSTFVVDWLQFVQATERKTARQIVRESACTPTTNVTERAASRGAGLQVNFPNPFPPGAAMAYALGRDARASLVVHDVAGRRVRTLVASAPHAAGPHRITWNGTDDTGRRVAAGVYVVLLRTEREVSSYRLALIP